MENGNKSKRTGIKIIYTLLVAILLFSLFFGVVSYSYINAKNDGFESLHIQTKEIKDYINLQMLSDRENLETMANFAAKLYSDGEDYSVLLNSFKSIGLIENIGILLPGNRFITGMGTIEAPDDIDFREESRKSPYISGRVPDITAPKREVVRSCVPIKAGDEIVGILYGVINPDTMKNKFAQKAAVDGTQLFVLDRRNGDFVVDTISEELSNISIMETRTFVEGYSYESLYTMLRAGNAGYSAFESQIIPGEVFFLHYAPLEFGEWQIMVAEPETEVFADAKKTGRTMALMFSGIVLIMVAYIWIIFSSERKDSSIHLCASKIRKLLLEINQQAESICDALKNIARFSAGRSAFFVDTDGEDYHYIQPALQNELLTEENRSYFASRLLNQASRLNKGMGTSVRIVEIVADSCLADEEPEFYEFMKMNGIKCVHFAAISNKNSHVSVLGVINPKQRAAVKMLLEDIAICFSMAIYNKKYLRKTETIAATDSLTGLSNRMAYKKDLAHFDRKHSESFSCIYIDVNELHVINNKYGHAAGDGMLLFIANALKETFNDGFIYRIGGDEFLVFNENLPKETVEERIKILDQKVEEMNYHISVGMDFCNRNVDTEELVFQAEKRMYEEKAKYYQMKEKKKLSEVDNQDIDRMATGIKEFDALLSVMSRRYHGVYCVSLNTGMARRILMPAYLKQFSEEKDSFKDAFTYYVREMVNPDYQRAMLSFLNYEVIRRQLLSGESPSIEYLKVDGCKVVLSVHLLPGAEGDASETIWVFENMD